MARIFNWTLGLAAALTLSIGAGCAEDPSDSGQRTTTTAGNATLGITEFRITESGSSLVITGVDASGNTVGEIDLKTGLFPMSGEFAMDSNLAPNTPVVGRKMTMKVGKVEQHHESIGYDVVDYPLNLGNPNPDSVRFNTFVDDMHVTPVLEKWGIHIGKSAGSEGENAYGLYEECDVWGSAHNGTSYSWNSNCGTGYADNNGMCVNWNANMDSFGRYGSNYYMDQCWQSGVCQNGAGATDPSSIRCLLNYGTSYGPAAVKCANSAYPNCNNITSGNHAVKTCTYSSSTGTYPCHANYQEAVSACWTTCGDASGTASDPVSGASGCGTSVAPYGTYPPYNNDVCWGQGNDTHSCYTAY